MRSILKFFLLALGVTTFLAACKKIDDLPYYGKGNEVTLTASQQAVAPAPADSATNVITFSWSNPNYATDTTNYKFLVQIDTAGNNFATPFVKEVLGAFGTSLTGRELNAIVLDYGFQLGVPHTLDVRVISSYANNNEQYTSNTVQMDVTPYSDPSVLTSTNNTVSGTLATGSQHALTFAWHPSFIGYAGTVTYTLQFDTSGNNFASLQEIPVGASIYSLARTNSEINENALDEGVAGGTTGEIEYRIKATTAQGAIAYSNSVLITVNTYVPLLRFYLPGGYQAATGNGNDWDPGTAPEFIRDLRPDVLNELYYMYIYLPANAEFKITQGRAWDINYGSGGGDNLALNGGNLSVSTAGVYRISIDMENMKFDVREGRMGFVGGATGAGWDPPSVFPNYAMGAPALNLFVGLTDFTADGWKLIDSDSWNNGSMSVTETRSYGSTGGSGSSMVINGDNFPNISTAGRYRVIWDGRDVNNIKYEMSPAEEMRVVGDGMDEAGVNDWDPGTSPQMTYQGDGVWTITLNLKADKSIKFLAGNAWGAFDYEDNSGGSQAVGTPRKINWSGGPDFKTPTVAGTYTITLDEYAQTVTIN